MTIESNEEAIIPTRPDWLGLHREEARNRDLAIIDSHHHLWHRSEQPYFLPEFLCDANSGHTVKATVFIECHSHYRTDGPDHLKPVGEVEYATSVAEECKRNDVGPKVASAIVGTTDLRLGKRTEEALDAMVEAGRGRFQGIRQTAVWHPDKAVKGSVMNPPPGLLFDSDFRSGMQLLHRKSLSFEAWALHTQLVEVLDLASDFPDVPIVVNHTGAAIGMGLYEKRRDLAFSEWKAAIGRLAMAPNVFLKIGGFGMRLWGFGFHQRPKPPTSEELAIAFAPYFEVCIESFGPNRCMFESNFPVDKGSFGYTTLWNAYKRLAEKCSESEQEMLCHGTAQCVYRIQES